MRVPDHFRIGLMLPFNYGVNFLESDRLGPDESYLAPIYRAITQEYEGEPVHLQIIYAETKSYLEAYRGGNLDGMIVVIVSLDDLPILRPLLDSSAYCVAVGISGSNPEDQDLPCVDCGNREGGRMAADHLLALGHRDFGCVNLAAYFVNQADRMQGFMERVADAGCPIEEDCVLTNPDYECHLFDMLATEWIKRLVRGQRMPTGLFSCDYNMTEATLAALQRNGLTVPGDVSLVGFDDPPKASRLTPPLTAIRQPVAEMGRRSARRLLDALKSADVRGRLGRTEILPPELVVRGSSGAVRTRSM
jgi:DNA-binding LacI/PurR family transcriptional regulator